MTSNCKLRPKKEFADYTIMGCVEFGNIRKKRDNNILLRIYTYLLAHYFFTNQFRQVGHMSLKVQDIDYFFRRGTLENPRFWARFGGKPDFTGKVVGDVGCGHGSLCVDVASAGARQVIGFDLDTERIESAQAIMSEHYPQLRQNLEFRIQDLADAPEREFDYFLSKDTFEHVIDLPKVLRSMKDRLKPGGQVFIGFGPLWNSPYGDHRRTKMRLPWGHVMVNEDFLVNRVNRLGGYCGSQVSSIHDIGLNKFSLADYRRMFNESGLKTVFFKVNHSTRPISRLFSSLRKVPLLEEYFSHNIYCILENPK